LELLGVLLALLFLGVLLYLLLKNRGEGFVGKSAAQKRAEIVAAYKQQMDRELGPLRHDPEALRQRQVELLRAFSIEVSSSVFFGPDEVRDVIGELARYGTEA